MNSKPVLNFNPNTVRPQWCHPYLEQGWVRKLSRAELEAYAYDFYLRMLPFFRKQIEGSILPGVVICYSARMRHKLGAADLFRRRISLNESYFRADPRLLPYTLFHEMVHIWLYDCLLDPGHNSRFYLKMQQFEATGLPIDPDVHIHERIASEAKYIYYCASCDNRWYTNRVDKSGLYCGYCHENKRVKNFPRPFLNPGRSNTTDQVRTGMQPLNRRELYERIHGEPLPAQHL